MEVCDIVQETGIKTIPKKKKCKKAKWLSEEALQIAVKRREVKSKGRSAVHRWKDSYFLRAESFFNVATNIEEMDRLPSPSRKIIESYGGRSLHEQSHGESFFSLMVNRFGGNGLYILDEPEAALSPARQIAMLHLIRDLVPHRHNPHSRSPAHHPCRIR